MGRSGSPLPFGVHRVPVRRRGPRRGRAGNVSIAFRRSPRSGPRIAGTIRSPLSTSPLPFGVHRVPVPRARWAKSSGIGSLHCLSAFTAFRSLKPVKTSLARLKSLHCLSAFTAFRSPCARCGEYFPILRSPLPFGVHRVPVWHQLRQPAGRAGRLHCLSAFTAFRSRQLQRQGQPRESQVSIAFRRSPRSGRLTVWIVPFETLEVSIAFRRSPRSGQEKLT